MNKPIDQLAALQADARVSLSSDVQTYRWDADKRIWVQIGRKTCIAVKPQIKEPDKQRAAIERKAMRAAKKLAREARTIERAAALQAARERREAKEKAISEAREAREAQRAAKQKAVCEARAAAKVERAAKQKAICEARAAREAQRAAKQKAISEARAAREAQRAAKLERAAQIAAQRKAIVACPLNARDAAHLFGVSTNEVYTARLEARRLGLSGVKESRLTSYQGAPVVQ